MDDPDWVIRPDSGIALPAGASDKESYLSLAYPDLVEWTAELDSCRHAAEWLGLGEQGLEPPGSNPQPDGSSRQMTAMEQAMYEEPGAHQR